MPGSNAVPFLVERRHENQLTTFLTNVKVPSTLYFRTEKNVFNYIGYKHYETFLTKTIISCNVLVYFSVTCLTACISKRVSQKFVSLTTRAFGLHFFNALITSLTSTI